MEHDVPVAPNPVKEHFLATKRSRGRGALSCHTR